jgi:hypothetical protein
MNVRNIHTFTRRLSSVGSRVRSRLAPRPHPNRVCVSLAPTSPPKGTVLLSYLTEPFLLRPGQPMPHSHTHPWEIREIGNTFLELGYALDVIRWTNQEFVPKRPYDVFIDARMNLERLAPLVGPKCLKIMHIDTTHWLFHMAAQHNRLRDLQARRGVTLGLHKTVSPNWAIEHADCATILGNKFTSDTYRYANKPLYRVPYSSPITYPWNDAKDFDACRKRFLWLGSGGLVHKGLDLVLEAFAGMPDHHLTVCGPIDAEPDFARAYQRELRETPNITTIGWIDTAGADFARIIASTLGFVYPS